MLSCDSYFQALLISNGANAFVGVYFLLIYDRVQLVEKLKKKNPGISLNLQVCTCFILNSFELASISISSYKQEKIILSR